MRNQLKIRLCTCLLIGLFLFPIFPLVSIGSSSGEASDEGSFPGVKNDFCMPSGTENDIYAIGGDGNVWHWNGAWWWQVTSGRIIEDRIQIVAQDEIYGLSRNPTGYLNVYKWNGTSWIAVTWDGSLTDSFQVISETQVYAIGEDRQVYFWNGSSWTGYTRSAQEVTSHIQVVDNLIYSINMQNQLVKWNGTEWAPVTDQKPIKDYFSLKNKDEIYSIDQTGNIVLWNGENWRPLTSSFSANGRLFYVSSSEIFTLGTDGVVWQWNGETGVKVTTNITDSYALTGSTYYRIKYIEGNVSSQAAIIAYHDWLVIAVRGTDDRVYIREWKPQRDESWDAARNSQNLGIDNWYSLEGTTDVSPELQVEKGVLSIYVMGKQGTVLRKSYLAPHVWSGSWEPMYLFKFSPGPYSSAGYTIVPIDNKGYPSPVAIVKYMNFTLPETKQDPSKLVIYELTTKEFTSPHGPGTGTFQSATEKLDYLKDLGINAIWLSGNSWSDPLHFTNTSTQYAVIDPALVDPSLGSDPTNITKTELELKSFIDSAHQRGIKVFFDVVSHGVMSYSPLVSYDASFPPYIAQYPETLNITAHPDWFGANTFPSDDECVDKASFPQNTHMVDFVGGYDQTDLDDWAVSIWNNYIVNFGIDGLRIDLGSTRFDLWARIKENANHAGRDLIIMPEGEVQDYPFDIEVYDFEQVNYAWTLFASEEYGQRKPGYGAVVHDMKTAMAELFPELPRQYNTIPISFHDSLSYDFEGNAFKMGYGAFFTPFIPVFMAGEEFNNPQSIVPNGTVPWLLSSVLNWNKLEQLENSQFYNYTKKAIQIRQFEPALTYFSPDIHNPNVALVTYASSAPAPCPYMRYLPNGSQAVLIAGNNNTKAVNVNMQLPLNEVGLAGYQYYDAVDLWSGETNIISYQDTQNYNLSIAEENFRIIKITPHTSPLPTTYPTPTPISKPTVEPTSNPTASVPNATQSTSPQDFSFLAPLTITVVTTIFVALAVLIYTQRKTPKSRYNQQT